MYEIGIDIARLDAKRWKQVVSDCAGKIDSVVALLKGKLSPGALEVIAKQGSGLFPTPRDIKMDCSCPDWAGLCKHLAAVLYGVGARLDVEPELFFTLRQVDKNDLIAAGAGGLGRKGAKSEKAGKSQKSEKGKQGIADADLASVFGIEIESAAPVKVAKAKKKVVVKASGVRASVVTPSVVTPIAQARVPKKRVPVAPVLKTIAAKRVRRKSIK